MTRTVLCSVTVAAMLVSAGCKSSVFQPDLGSRFHLPRWAGGSDDDADTVGNASLGNPGKTANEWLAKGHAAFDDQQLTDARDAYRQALVLDGSLTIANHRLAIIADQQKDFVTAEQHYTAALKARPDDPDLLNDFGYSKFRQGDYPAAESMYRRAIDRQPDHQKAWKNLGWLYGQLNNYEKAREAFRRGGTEAESRANLVQLFPNGPPGSASTRQLDELEPPPFDSGIPATGGFPDRAVSTAPDLSMPPDATARRVLPLDDTPPARPLARSNITGAGADGSARLTNPAPLDPAINPAGFDRPTTTTRLRIPADQVREAARLGLSTGPGQLFPTPTGSDTSSSAVPPSSAIPIPAGTSFGGDPALTPPKRLNPPAARSLIDPISSFEERSETDDPAELRRFRDLLQPPVPAGGSGP